MTSRSGPTARRSPGLDGSGSWVAGREWALPPEVFWQVHPAAADTLANAVLELLDPRPGEHAWDLYGGAGLFAAVLADRGADVTLVESSAPAVAVAREQLPGVRDRPRPSGGGAAAYRRPAA